MPGLTFPQCIEEYFLGPLFPADRANRMPILRNSGLSREMTFVPDTKQYRAVGGYHGWGKTGLTWPRNEWREKYMPDAMPGTLFFFL